jgi:hypothetical protein
MLARMTTRCAYCDRAATATIIATPDRVCAEHLREFWTGLLGYTHRRAGPCVKGRKWCPCMGCEEERRPTARTYVVRTRRAPKHDADESSMRIAS